MKLYEYMFLILSIISLADIIINCIRIYRNKELFLIIGVEEEIKRMRIDVLVILIASIIFTYKFLF